MTLSDLKSFIDISKKEIEDSKKSLGYLQEIVEKQKELIKNLEQAVQVLTDVLSITQQEIIQYIENVVTTALQYIYGEDYSFKIDYQLKRGQPEVELYVLKGNLRYDFQYSCGVGVLNIVSFGLRCACWSLIEPPTRPLMVVDEPFSSISGKDQLEKAELMVKKLSDMLGIQIVLVSGKYPITNYADRLFLVGMENSTSIITMEK